MKLGITLIVTLFLAWLWFISGAPPHRSTAQWIASGVLLLMFIWPGVIIVQETRINERKRKKLLTVPPKSGYTSSLMQ